MAEFSLRSHSYDGRYLYVTCTQEAVPGENKSLLHWTLTVTGGSVDYYTTGPTTLVLDGQQVYYAPITGWTSYKFPAARGAVSGTIEVFHGAQGEKTVECSLETAIYTGILKTARATWDLDAIPQASTVGATDGPIGGTCMVVVDRKNSAYTHTLALYTDSLEGFLQSDGALSQTPVKLESTGIAFSIPVSFYEKIPNARKLPCRLVCTTYLEETQIGESRECTFQAYCREEDCLPLVDAAVTDCNEMTLALTGDENTLVRFFSRAMCRMDALGKNGATIVKKQVGALEMEGQWIELPGVESGTFLLQVTDSRGYRGETTLELPLIPYRKLTANCTARRQGPTSDKVALTVTGDWWQGNFGLEENALQGVCRVGQEEIPLTVNVGEETYTATASLEGLSYDKGHILTVEVADRLMIHTVAVTVNPGVPVFDWGERDFTFHVPVVLADGSEAVSQRQLTEEAALLRAYPVGSLYLSWSHICPAELFGGTWERVINPETGEGVFLYSAAQEEEIGKLGGEKTHTLTVEEMPAHNHGLYFRNKYTLNGPGNGLTNITGGELVPEDIRYMEDTGGGLPHNNIPPYVKVSVWRRIA